MRRTTQRKKTNASVAAYAAPGENQRPDRALFITIMNCPFCGHPKIIVDRRAPINGSYLDENEVERHRMRCEKCQRPIRMQDVQPTRPPKGGRGTMQT